MSLESTAPQLKREPKDPKDPEEATTQEHRVVPQPKPKPTLELVVDNDSEEVETHMREVLHDTLYTLNQYADHLERNRSEVQKNREKLDSWYHKFTEQYKRQQHIDAQLGAALEQVQKLRSNLKHNPNSYKEVQNALFQLQEELHQSAIAPYTEKVGVLEKRPQAPEMDWEHADRLGELMRIEENGKPMIEATFSGFAKQHKNVGKLGEYGQDSGLVNAAAGIVMQIDGSGSVGPESYRAGLVYGEKVHDILRGLPENEHDADAIREYIIQRYQNEMPHVLRWMPHHEEQTGGAVMIAARILPEAGLVVVFRIGDGHLAMKQGDQVQDLLPKELWQPEEVSMNREPKAKNQVQGIGLSYNATASGQQIKEMMPTPQIAVYPFDATQDMEMIAVSDGFDRLKMGTLVDLMEKNGSSALANIERPEQPRDDMLAIGVRYQGRSK